MIHCRRVVKGADRAGSTTGGGGTAVIVIVGVLLFGFVGGGSGRPMEHGDKQEKVGSQHKIIGIPM